MFKLCLSAALISATVCAFASNGTPSGASQSPNVVNVAFPYDGTYTLTTIPIVASAAVAGAGIDAMTVNVDGYNVQSVQGGQLYTNISVAPGNHRIFVKAWDTRGRYYDDVLNITALSPNGSPSQGSQSATAVVVQAPANGAQVGNSVLVQASAAVPGVSISAMTVNVDGANVLTVQGSAVNNWVTLSPGPHTIYIKAWDAYQRYYDDVVQVTAAGSASNGYASQHVFVLMLENRSDAAALQWMPFLSGLAGQYGQATQTYSPSHGSWNAYGEITAGIAPFDGMALNGACNGSGCYAPQNIPNLVRQFAADGKSWKGYFQSIPVFGWMGAGYGNYVERHNPFPFFTDVAYSGYQQQNMVDDQQLLRDVYSGNAPNYSLIVPDLAHDGHDPADDYTALTNADNYLSWLLPQLLASPYFQPGGDGVLIVTFDESDLYNDNSCGTTPDPNNCGGHVFLSVIGPRVKRNFVSSQFHRQADVLRASCDLLGLSGCPGDGAQARGLSEFFNAPQGCSPPATPGVNLCSPSWGQISNGAVEITAAGTPGNGSLQRLELWIDGTKINNYHSSQIDVTVPLGPGIHAVAVVEVDTNGAYIPSNVVPFVIQ